MKIFKTVLSVIFAGVLVAGCKGGEKKAEKTEEAPVTQEAQVAASAPAAGPAELVKVADIFAKKGELNGKNITVHGKVVKVNMGIMGKNWIHLQDGTGAAGTNDITITTDGQAKVEDKIVVTGTVVTDKDFGSGYKYAVIIENATVAAE
ncbi:MAG: hypothetical protein PHX78_03035 [bacterium]|nr:hypothetical protein [bacterium]